MPTVYRHLLLYIKNAHEAQELSQDIFMVIWNNREKLQNMDNFSGYLYVITRNKALRAVKGILDLTDEPPEDMIQTLLHSPDSTVELKDLQQVLYKGIDLLPNRRKEVFKLSRIENLTYEEIAGQLQISKSAVKQHIIESLIFLRIFIKEKADVIISVLLLYVFYCL